MVVEDKNVHVDQIRVDQLLFSFLSLSTIKEVLTSWYCEFGVDDCIKPRRLAAPCFGEVRLIRSRR